MRRAATALALFAVLSGCITTVSETRRLELEVRTEPPGAYVWLDEGSGRRTVGPSPARVEREITEARYEFEELWWLWPLAGAATLATGLSVGVTSSSRFDGPTTQTEAVALRDSTNTAGVILLSAGSLLLVTGLLACTIGELVEGSPVAPPVPLVIGATRDGYADESLTLSAPFDARDLRLVLRPTSGATPVAAPAPAPSAPAFGDRVVAVFDVEDSSARLDHATLDQVTDYLASGIAARGTRVVPRSQIRERLKESKRDTYRPCFDESCQIELGKAVAAEKSLATKILRIEDTCALTSTLYDLRTETTERAATTRTGCGAGELLKGIDEIVLQLLQLSK